MRTTTIILVVTMVVIAITVVDMADRLIRYGRATPVQAEAAPTRPLFAYKLVADTIIVPPDTIYHCIHWSPCTSCEFQCFKK